MEYQMRSKVIVTMNNKRWKDYVHSLEKWNLIKMHYEIPVKDGLGGLEPNILTHRYHPCTSKVKQ